MAKREKRDQPERIKATDEWLEAEHQAELAKKRAREAEPRPVRPFSYQPGRGARPGLDRMFRGGYDRAR